MNKRNFRFDRIKKIVVKIGTSVLTDPSGFFSLSNLRKIIAQVDTLQKSGREVMVVTSGAIGCGMKALGLKRKPKELKTLQACAAIGQSHLMKNYEELFGQYERRIGQVLLTRIAFQDRTRCMNIRNTLQELLHLRATPVINENDTVSTEEIRFGDNDTLSVCVAELVEADLLVLLSDVDGLYVEEAIVGQVDDASEVDRLFAHIFSKKKNVVTAGGMTTKLEAAKRAMRSGISTVMLNGTKDDVVLDFLSGEPVGTFFVGSKVKQGFKRNWLTDLTQASGNLLVDEGAYNAIVKNGKSLLPSGIRNVEGNFAAGDSVRISGPDGKMFARGIVNYSKDELVRIRGAKTSEILSILGYKHDDEVIHRDDLVVVE